jgi:hypothetical protein
MTGLNKMPEREVWIQRKMRRLSRDDVLAGEAPALQRILIAFSLVRRINAAGRRRSGEQALLAPYRKRFPVLKLGRYPHSLAAASRLYLLFRKSLSSIPGFLIRWAFVRGSATAR